MPSHADPCGNLTCVSVPKAVLQRSSTAGEDFTRTVRNATVAVLLLGRAFRTGIGGLLDMSCLSSSIQGQRLATMSWRMNVIDPLVSAHANVEIYFSFPRCANSTNQARLWGLMMQWLQPHVRGSWIVHSRGIAHGWRLGYEGLMKQNGWQRFDYVLHGRHDLHIGLPISAWPAFPSWRAWLFEQFCIESDIGCDCSLRPARKCGARHVGALWTGPVRESTVSESTVRAAGPAASERGAWDTTCVKRAKDNGVCTADGIVWTPGAHLRRMVALVRASARDPDKPHGHAFIRSVYASLGYSLGEYPLSRPPSTRVPRTRPVRSGAAAGRAAAGTDAGRHASRYASSYPGRYAGSDASGAPPPLGFLFPSAGDEYAATGGPCAGPGREADGTLACFRHDHYEPYRAPISEHFINRGDAESRGRQEQLTQLMGCDADWREEVVRAMLADRTGAVAKELHAIKVRMNSSGASLRARATCTDYAEPLQAI